MEINSGRISPKFKLAVSLRNPVVDKEYTTTTKQVVKITKSYPEFNKDGIPAETHKEFESNRAKGSIVLTEKDINFNDTESKKNVKPVPQKPKESEISSNKKAENIKPADASKKTEEKIDASEFSKDDLDDPNNLENMVSIKFMEFAIAKMDADIKKIEGRTPTKIRQKFLGTKCRYNTLKEQVMDGSISVENYVMILNKQVKKDKRLAEYFKQNDLKEKAAMVFERLKIIVKELEELMPHLKK